MIAVLGLIALVVLAVPYLSGVPNEPFYSSIFCALIFLAVLTAVWYRKGKADFGLSRNRSLSGRAEIAFGILLGIALLSLLLRLIADHTLAYLGPMLRGWMVLAAEVSIFALMRRMGRGSRAQAYVLMLCLVLASALVAEVGVNEYLAHRSAGQPDWRVFATSTPDFLAGYLVMLIPLTLSLFLGVPWQKQKQPLIGRLLTALLLVVLGMQALVLLRTQSRFALVSLTIGLVVFLIALWKAQRNGLRLEPSSRGRLAAIGAFLLVFGVLLARPVIARLRHTSVSDNSTAFRLYTWRGAIKMAADNPVLGTGIGSWVNLYPRYAITGFTRLAHNSYLQMADECGLPGLLALLGALGFIGAAGWQGLKEAPPPDENRPPLSYIALEDDRLALAGLLGGVTAGVVQNLIDSDWYVFFLGITFWAMAGLVAGLSEPKLSWQKQEQTAQTKQRLAIGLVAALLLADASAQGLAAWYAHQADTALASPSPTAALNAEQDLADAAQWDPLNAHYPENLGYLVFLQREGRIPDAIAALQTAADREPSGLIYSQLAAAFDAAHQYPEAIAALQKGLHDNPNSIQSRLTLAEMLPPPQSIDYCRQIARLELSPVGRVRALGNLVEYQFAVADSCVGDADAASGKPAAAVRYYQRAEHVLEQYADEGGTNNIMRQAIMGDHPDPALDAQMSHLYAHVMAQLAALSPPSARPALRLRAAAYAAKYANVFAHSSGTGI